MNYAIRVVLSSLLKDRLKYLTLDVVRQLLATVTSAKKREVKEREGSEKKRMRERERERETISSHYGYEMVLYNNTLSYQINSLVPRLVPRFSLLQTCKENNTLVAVCRRVWCCLF